MSLERTMQAVREQPLNAGAWAELGEVLNREGRSAEAEASFERALALDPSQEEWASTLHAIQRSGTLPEWFDELERETGGGMEVAVRPATPVPLTFPTWLLPALGLVGLLILAAVLLRGPAMQGPRLLAPSTATGQTREEAAPLGETLCLENGLCLRVEQVHSDSAGLVTDYYYDTDGDEEAERQPQPPAGMHAVAVRLLVENTDADEEEYISPYDMGIVGQDGVAFAAQCGFVVEDLGWLGLEPGERTEGNVCFLVAEGTVPTHLVYTSYNERRYFRLTDE